MTGSERDEMDEVLDAYGAELIELRRRASRERWSIQEMEAALLERLIVMHGKCMDWVKKKRRMKDFDRRSDDDQCPGRGVS